VFFFSFVEARKWSWRKIPIPKSVKIGKIIKNNCLNILKKKKIRTLARYIITVYTQWAKSPKK